MKSLLDAEGTPLTGFDASACDVIEGNEVARAVSWRGQSDVSGLREKAVRVKITLAKASLYAFRFSR